MLVLNEQDQQQLLNMEEVIEEVAQSLQAFSEGKTETPLRYVLPFNDENRYLVMPALSDELKIVGIKTVTFAPDNPKKGKKTITGSVLLSDYETGETLAVLDGSYLTKIRTGAISGVATKYLAREDAKTLCVIGAGDQAEGLIVAVMAVRNIETVHFSSRTKENAERLAQTVKKEYNVSTKVFDEGDDAMEEADIVVTATNSTKPVYSHSLHPGVHLNAVGSFKPEMQELPSDSMLVANKIVVESVEAAMEETGDLKVPQEEGIITKESLHGELGDIVAGKIPGRENDKEVTLFKSVGLAIVDIVVANYFYKKAVENSEK
ncbi:ornithine cyclodeaminase family protein [Staphylococcus sp. NRL 16/872]|uniref:ornithine cyclodeaminase family protein n=1 Tax=Staphylococcus sp. NRL 16/872 TaxID=2930131 RepID=UPI001FB30C20|nr:MULTISPECIES: ornithine cyclodeaminase family protein [unclassified Staphylococcus]MCJ1657088.1 ornithine cyclodeaminase family protein [Staphylococcus sp. NRL 21/187]MCJ1662831.1 ornithine cyclodeaminase family protein [Staphylococcus sp. NRL 18/288]MCJ1668948.1 ornithine cyclodeaminase family protein [Staphylococcus sp. NRL 19/737]WEN69165.1 ornithine cyclodeaminase family protein [Staphylococcus sp. NRL 16/872]